MEELNELEVMMEEVIQQVSEDLETGISRFLQANPYTSFEHYNFRLMKNKPDLFEKTLYYESDSSRLYKEHICHILEKPNGKNIFFLVGYQGCGKTTFIHSVINKYRKETAARVLVLDCDKKGKDPHQIQKTICGLIKKCLKEVSSFNDYIDFYNANIDVIDEFDDDIFNDFFDIVKEINETDRIDRHSNEYRRLNSFINSMLSIKQAIYLLILLNLAHNYSDKDKLDEKLMLFIDNLDCIDEYNELAEFISCIDSLTVDMSEVFEKFKLCTGQNLCSTFVSKIKIFIAMRETTKANLPSSHFSDAFKSIYTNKDITECYDKGEIVKKRIYQLFDYDKKGLLKEKQKNQIQLLLDVIDDVYTANVIYPLFNNNYRSAVEMLVRIIIAHSSTMESYVHLSNLEDSQYKHGARGVLFKFIFDELNKSTGNEPSCFKRIGVLDLLNRKNNSVSICRLILSYLSNYTETKCDSGRNSIALRDILNNFEGIFEGEKVVKTLWEMFSLRDTDWSHLVSFNQIEYENTDQAIGGNIDFNRLNPDKTMLHYSCAGKIYIEYVATHFEFFTARVYKTNREALFCNSNLLRDTNTQNFKCIDIVNKIYGEVEQCCAALKQFNINLCEKSHFLNPYSKAELYKESHYVCMFKRIQYDGQERRFKQFHEERIILTHINYIDCYRSYVLKYCDMISYEDKLEINQKLVECISKYVELLASNAILKNKNTDNELVKHYRRQIGQLEDNWNDFETEIRKND